MREGAAGLDFYFIFFPKADLPISCLEPTSWLGTALNAKLRKKFCRKKSAGERRAVYSSSNKRVTCEMI